MWKELLNRVLGGGPKPEILTVPDLPQDKPDYSGVIIAAVAAFAVIAVIYFLSKAKA